MLKKKMYEFKIRPYMPTKIPQFCVETKTVKYSDDCVYINISVIYQSISIDCNISKHCFFFLFVFCYI